MSDGCALHSGESIVAYCKDCAAGICAMCQVVEHATHRMLSLSDATRSSTRQLKHMSQRSDIVRAQLDGLIQKVEPLQKELDMYINDELASLEEVLEAKRAQLIGEVQERAKQMRKIVMDELLACEAELAVIQKGQQVLGKMSRREGTIPGRLGQLICDKLSYDDFTTEVDVHLHEPPRLQQMLELQLPTQSLQEVCDLITWTTVSVSSGAQIFPVDE
jgi:hypothetical protein